MNFTITQIPVLLLVAALCSTLGGVLSGYSLGGCLVTSVIGFSGALLGMWLAQALHLPELLTVRVGSENIPIVWSTIGSTLLILILGLMSRRRGLSW